MLSLVLPDGLAEAVPAVGSLSAYSCDIPFWPLTFSAKLAIIKPENTLYPQSYGFLHRVCRRAVPYRREVRISSPERSWCNCSLARYLGRVFEDIQVFFARSCFRS